MPQAVIPNVRHEIEKAMEFRIFMGIDTSNALYQFPITERSRQILASQSPWGLVEPRFLFEMVSLASGHLHATMVMMFGSFSEWGIVIFDNIMLLAHDVTDAARKLNDFSKMPRTTKQMQWFLGAALFFE